MNIEYTKEKWDARKITPMGFIKAAIDAILMGIYLIGVFISAIYILPEQKTPAEFIFIFAIIAFLMYGGIARLHHLIYARDYYEVTFGIKKEFERSPSDTELWICNSWHPKRCRSGYPCITTIPIDSKFPPSDCPNEYDCVWKKVQTTELTC